MSAARQWLVDPLNTETPAYLTNNQEVAAKRAAKGDFVQLIERCASRAAADPDYRPYYPRFKTQAAKPPVEDDEL